MDEISLFPLIAVDIGNSQIKLGRFDQPTSDSGLPHPDDMLQLPTDQWDPLEIALWLAPARPADFSWRVASVHGDAAARLSAWLEVDGAGQQTQVLTHDVLPLVVDVDAPQAVGIDRLLGAVAANRLRDAERIAIVVDLGSAITVDVISARGSFSGGAILPGIGMSTRALTEFTDLLPDIGLTELTDPPPALGTSTHDAIAAGIYWGAIGAVRLLIERLMDEMGSGDDTKGGDNELGPQVFLTGGAAESVALQLGEDVHYEPHLILAGLVLGSLE